MAYIIRSTSETFDTAAATFTPALPEHASGDLILCCITQDTGTTAISTATSGWAMIGTQAVSGAVRQAWAYKIAASSSETDPTFSGTTEEWVVSTIIVKDFDSANPIHVQARADWNAPAGGLVNSAAVTTTNNDCLILYSWGSDGVSPMITLPGDMTIVEKVKAVSSVSLVGWRNLVTAGSATTVTARHQLNTEGGNAWTIAINNSTGGNLAPEVKTVCDVLSFCGGTNFSIGTLTGLSTVAASISGTTCSAAVPSVSTTATILDSPYINISTFTSSTSATPAFEGGVITLPATTDFTNSSLAFSFSVTTSKAAARYGAFGIGLLIADASGNWVAYRLVSLAALVLDRLYSFIGTPGEGDIYASSGTLDITSINKVALFTERTAATSSNAVYRIKNITKQSGVVAVGGTAALPLLPSVLHNAISTTHEFLSYSAFQGVGQLLRKQAITIGNGTDATYCSFSSKSIELPKTQSGFISPASGQNFLADDYSCNLFINASSADTIDFSSAIISAANMQLFEINSASSLSATYNFKGMSLINFDANWKTGIDVTSVNFISCGAVDLKQNDITNCLFKNSVDASGVLIQPSSTLNNSTFETQTPSNYAIEINTAGSFVFDGNVFTGFTTDINVTAVTGTVTITLSVGDQVPTYTTAGATVNIVSPTVDIIATVVAGSRVQIYNETTATEIDNVIEPTTSYSYTVTSEASAGDIIRIRVTKLGLDAYTGQAIFNATGGASFFVSQPTDAVYTANGIDGSTVTEFIEDYPNVQVDIDDPDGITNLSRLYAWYCYVITTASGIEDWFGGLVAEDVANYRIVDSILDLKLDNVDTAGVIFTGGQRLYREDGAIPVVMSTSGGGSIVLYADKVFIAETGTSGLTSGEAATLAKIDTLTEDSGGLRFTTKALETAPSGGGSSDALTLPLFIGLK